MRPAEAKELVLGLMLGGGLEPADGLSVVDPVSPDGDQAKFLIAGKVARAIHHFDGWYVPINLGWFVGGYDLAMTSRRSTGRRSTGTSSQSQPDEGTWLLTTLSVTICRCAIGYWLSQRPSVMITAITTCAV